MIHEMCDVGGDAGKRPVWMETPVEYIGKYSVWLSRSRTAAISSESGLNGEAPHGTQNADIADDPARFCLQAAV